MNWVGSTIAGIAVGLAWLAIWAYVLHAFGLALLPLLQRNAEDRARRRERIKQMGKLRYIMIFGVLGSGLAFGLAMTTMDFLSHDPHSWISEIGKLAFLAAIFGWVQGAWTWSEKFREPVPFPPNYPPVT